MTGLQSTILQGKCRWITTAATVLGFTLQATVAAASAAETTFSDVTGVPLDSGVNALIGYRSVHFFNETVEPGTLLPGARISAEQFPAAFRGVWGPDAGEFGAWLAPQGSFVFQFEPVSTRVENIYFTNSIPNSTFSKALPLNAGDRFELAMAEMVGNAPLPWDRRKGEENGTLEWDHARLATAVDAQFNGASGSANVVIFRADLVARGGDINARTRQISAPPLVIDIPEAAVNQTPLSIVSTVFPYTAYIADFDFRILNGTGKAVLNASVQGYLYQAKEFALPSGAEVTEWHLPIVGLIMLGEGGELSVRSALSLAAPGRVLVQNSDHRWRIDDLPAGATVYAGAGTKPKIANGNGIDIVEEDLPATVESVPEHGEPSRTSTTADTPSDTVLISELAQASAINHRLPTAMDLELGNGQYALTMDPAYRGGFLALREPRRIVTGNRIASSLTTPFVTLNDFPVALTADRLVDLRIVPYRNYFSIRFTGLRTVESPFSLVRTELNRIFVPGLVLDAVYDLGNEQFAFVNFEFEPDPTAPGALSSHTLLVGLDGTAPGGRMMQAVELPEIGPVEFAGIEHETEFAEPFDIRHPDSARRSMAIGNHLLFGTLANPAPFGEITVVRTPTPLTPDPTPDSAVSIVEKPLTLFYGPDDASISRRTHVDISLLQDGPAPVADPRPLGTPGLVPPQIIDGPVADAPPEFDIIQAWLDADRANLYATLQIADLPEHAPVDTEFWWTLHWRHEHSGRFARAIIDEDGVWRFDFGGFNQGFFKTDDVQGEVQGGDNGFIRIIVLRKLLALSDGELLRETSAHAWIQQTGFTVPVEADSAPDGTDDTFGSGADFQMSAAREVTEQIELVAGNVRFADGIVRFDLALQNQSSDAIRSPLQAELTSVQSASGTVAAANADNDLDGKGALWSYDKQLGGDAQLRVGEITEPRRLAFNDPTGEPFSIELRIISGVFEGAPPDQENAGLISISWDAPRVHFDIDPIGGQIDSRMISLRDVGISR